MILDQLERAFMMIGDRLIMAGGGQKNFDNFEITDGNTTNELIVRPRKPSNDMPKETRISLNNMTKRMICDLCVERFGVELSYRNEKKHLITEFIAIQDTLI